MAAQSAFVNALIAAQAAPEWSGDENIFGFLIGSRKLDAILYDGRGGQRKTRGELHASWVLEGRAIQDLFIYSRRGERSGEKPAAGDRYATTIRTYDPARRAWRIDFINPADEQTSAQLLARKRGEVIVIEGKLSGGTPIRWGYDAITSNSFHYTAQKQDAKGSWQLYLELFGRQAA